MGHPQKVTLEILWRSDFIWLRYLGSQNVYLFVCLFVCLKIFFHPRGTPTERSPENLVNIWLDLAEILRIRKLDWKCLFVWLFVCLFIDLYIFCFDHPGTPTRIFLNISWRSDLIWPRYLGSKTVYLFVFLFVYYVFVFYFYFSHLLDTNRNIPWKFREDPTWFGWDIKD